MPLTIRPLTSDVPETVLLALEGAVTLAEAEALDAHLERICADGRTRWVALDLAAVRYVNSTGLGVLIKQATRLREREGGIALLGVSAKVRVVVEMLGLEHVFASVCQRRPVAAA